MSHYDYKRSTEMARGNYTFAAYIMGAMRKADDRNLYLLKAAWPEIFEEFEARYNAPGGILEGERIYDEDADRWVTNKNGQVVLGMS